MNAGRATALANAIEALIDGEPPEELYQLVMVLELYITSSNARAREIEFADQGRLNPASEQAVKLGQCYANARTQMGI